MHFNYSLFQIHFSTNSISHFLSHLNIISSLILYFFLSSFILPIFFPNNYIFLIKSVIFTTFFVILSQKSHQNLMWKVATSSNLNPPLKLFFYSPILAYNNLLLKIYCENIVVVFLNYHFLFFILFFLSHHLSSIRFFFFFFVSTTLLSHSFPLSTFFFFF